MSTHKVISSFVLMIAASGTSTVGAVIEVPADYSTIQQGITEALAGDVIGPAGHQNAPLLKEVRSAIGGDNLVALDVGKARLRNLVRCVGCLGQPIAKA